MTPSISNPKFGQFINYYLDHAATGKHSPTGEPRTEKYIHVSRSLVDHHIPGELRREPFLELSSQNFQQIIDDVAFKSDSAPRGLKRFLVDLDAFAIHLEILSVSRTKDLTIPDSTRRERVLTDKMLGEAWTSLLRNVAVGGLPARLSCLAVVVSTATLQPLSSILKIRKDWLTDDCGSWVDPTMGHNVYVPTVARAHLGYAIAIGDIAHGTNGTAFVFPTVGSKSDRAVNFPFEKAHELIKLPLDDKTKPQDLVATGIARLREQDEAMGPIVDRIVGPNPMQADAAHVAVLEAWCGQLHEMEKTIAAARWR